MFYFQTMFQQVYNGITGSTVLPAVQQIAEAILLLAALFAVYEAYAKGGDAWDPLESTCRHASLSIL